MTLAIVREKLVDLFNNSTLQTITPNAYAYDLIQLVKARIGTQYSAKMMYDAEINFIQYLLSPIKYRSPATQENTEYQLIINYVKEVDLDGQYYLDVTDFYETLYSTIQTVLGDNWDGAILGYNTQQTAPRIVFDFLHDKNVWVSEIEISIIA
jgi:hypothetical protein